MAAPSVGGSSRKRNFSWLLLLQGRLLELRGQTRGRSEAVSAPLDLRGCGLTGFAPISHVEHSDKGSRKLALVAQPP